MRPHQAFRLLPMIAATLAFALCAPAAFADDDVDDGSKFNDRDRLIETLLNDDSAAVEDANQALEDAEAALEQAVQDGASDEEITALTEERDAAQMELTDASDSAAGEQDEVTGLVGQLDDDQVFALNRSLNNAVNSKLLVDFDAEELQMIVDGDYNKRQINAFTKALESEAKFASLADRFTEKAETTGDDKFLDKADRMTLKGETQKGKFLAKVERHGDAADVARGAAKDEAKSVAKSAAKASGKDSAKGAAKQAAKDAAKDAAKAAAKSNAKANAKDNAKQAAKLVVKEEGKNAAKGKGKGKNKDG